MRRPIRPQLPPLTALYLATRWIAGRTPAARARATTRQRRAHLDQTLPHVRVDLVRPEARRLVGLRPPEARDAGADLTVLLETVVFRWDVGLEREAWALLGVPARSGRKYLHGESAVPWPVWFTARTYGLGELAAW